MYYSETMRDIFENDNESKNQIYAQCISADFGMGKGIAIAFNNKFNCKTHLLQRMPENFVSDWHKSNPCRRIIRDDRVFCLVTKRHYWEKPTNDTLRLALFELKQQIKDYATKNNYVEKDILLVIPPLGCGLDRLNYPTVKSMIHEIFQDMDIRIECRTNNLNFANKYFDES